MNLKFWYHRKILVISLLLVFFYPYEMKGADQSKRIAASDLFKIFDTYAEKQNISEQLKTEGKTIKADQLKEEAKKWLKSSLVGKKFYLVTDDMTISEPLKIFRIDSSNSDDWKFILRSDVCLIDLGRAKYQRKRRGIKGRSLKKFINDKNLILEKIQDIDIFTNFNYKTTFQVQFLVQELEEDYYSESYGYYKAPLIVGQLLQWKPLKVSFEQKKKESGDYDENEDKKIPEVAEYVFSIEDIMSGQAEIELEKRFGLEKRLEGKQKIQVMLEEKRRKIEMQQLAQKKYKEEMTVINLQWIDVVFPFFPIGNLLQGDFKIVSANFTIIPIFGALIGVYVASDGFRRSLKTESSYIIGGFAYGLTSLVYWLDLWAESANLSKKYSYLSYLRNIKFDIYHDGVVLGYSYKF